MKRHLNLLPPKVQKRRSGLTAMVMWTVVLCLLVSGWWIGKKLQLQRNENARLNVESLEREFQPLRRMKKELVKISNRITEIKAAAESKIDLDDVHPTLSLLGLISESSNQVKQKLGLENITLEEIPAKTKSSINGNYRLILRGLAVDRLAIAKFAALLRDSQYFEFVQSKDQVEQSNSKFYRFQLECRY